MARFNPGQRGALALLVTASAFDGVTQGILLLQESIARKALAASDLDIALIGVIANGTMLLSFFVSYFFAGRSKKALVAGGYLAGRLVFVLSFMITRSSVLLGFLFLYHALFAVQVPVLNGFYQRVFGPDRGRAFGIVRTVLILFTMLASLATGRILDLSPGSYRAALAVIAASGLVTYAIIFLMESRVRYEPAPRPRLRDLAASFREIAGRAPFMRFEAVFMTYGLAFMICVPAVPIYLLRNLGLSYADMSLAQGIVAQSVILVLTPFAGRVFDRMNLWTISAWSNVALFFYPLSFLLSWFLASRGLAFAGLAFYSLGLSGTNILWNLGAAGFSRDERDSFLLQSFHISLTGMRGLFGPLLGLLILSTAGLQWNFAISGLLFAAAALMAIAQARKPAASRAG